MRLPFFSLWLAIVPLHAEIALKKTDERLQVTIDGELFTEYRSDRNVPCLYPLISASGGGLTRNFPLTEATAGEQTDHPHHVSMWFTHGNVNQVDFWAGHLKRKGRIVHRKFGPVSSNSTTSASSDSTDPVRHRASFSVELEWVEGEIIHLREDRSYTIHATETSRVIDVTSVLTAADGDVVFGDTKEGSFALRLTPTLRLKGKVAKGSILNSNGEKNGECWGKRAAWVAYSGPDAAGEPAVVAVFDHPANLRHPTWWHARDYGLVAANPFGQHDFEGKKDKHLGDHRLKKGESLTFRHRVLLHHGNHESAMLEQTMKDFSKVK